jgi:hypothetical protein
VAVGGEGGARLVAASFDGASCSEQLDVALKMHKAMISAPPLNPLPHALIALFNDRRLRVSGKGLLASASIKAVLGPFPGLSPSARGLKRSSAQVDLPFRVSGLLRAADYLAPSVISWEEASQRNRRLP